MFVTSVICDFYFLRVYLIAEGLPGGVALMVSSIESLTINILVQPSLALCVA